MRSNAECNDAWPAECAGGGPVLQCVYGISGRISRGHHLSIGLCRERSNCIEENKLSAFCFGVPGLGIFQVSDVCSSLPASERHAANLLISHTPRLLTTRSASDSARVSCCISFTLAPAVPMTLRTAP